MKSFVVDPRDGGFGQGSCNTCCCQPFSMRPNEIDKMMINYAPWSVPIGGLGLVIGGTEVSIERNSTGCSAAQIDGFGPPIFINQNFPIVLNTATVINFATVPPTPLGNTFQYRIVSMSGPSNGTLVDTGTLLDGIMTYTPNNGYVGYDFVWIEVTDAQGRKTIKQQRFVVGVPLGVIPPFLSGVVIDSTKIIVNPNGHMISFPISMMPDARQCEFYKLTIKQNARDCNDLYSHISCFDISVGNC